MKQLPIRYEILTITLYLSTLTLNSLCPVNGSTSIIYLFKTSSIASTVFSFKNSTYLNEVTPSINIMKYLILLANFTNNGPYKFTCTHSSTSFFYYCIAAYTSFQIHSSYMFLSSVLGTVHTRCQNQERWTQFLFIFFLIFYFLFDLFFNFQFLKSRVSVRVMICHTVTHQLYHMTQSQSQSQVTRQ